MMDPFKVNIIRKLQHISKSTFIIGGLILLCLVGFLDYITGYELSFSLFYLIPIAMLSWVTSSRIGAAISFISACVWLAADTASGAQYSRPIIYFWNTLIRFGFFLIIVLLIKVAKNLELEKKISRTDYLTGAINNRFLNELMQVEIDRSVRYKRPFTMAFIDLDNFKSINDQFGHLVGDKVLETVVQTMQKNLRKTDVVARAGGDEFAILLPEADEDVAKTAISKVQHGLLNEMRANHWAITFSIGAVTFITPPASANTAINMADELMYSVKTNGKNNIAYMTIPNRETSKSITS